MNRLFATANISKSETNLRTRWAVSSYVVSQEILPFNEILILIFVSLSQGKAAGAWR
jgi:hypothetical protein